MIIRSKVVPPSVPQSVTFRPRLADRLADLIERRPVVCVYATAGAGKTTAVSQAVRRLDRPLSWLSVDATDTAPGRLLTYLEAALATKYPDVAGVVGAALAAELSHVEAAGLLAESLDGLPALLVLDDLERLAEAPAALSVLGAFLRYAPATVRVVLISRSELRLSSADLGFSPWEGRVGETDLAFTIEEAADALALTGREEVDPAKAIEVTGGWVTGVLFEVWCSAGHTSGFGGEADPLYGYLAVEVLDQLSEREREFLVTTAVLEDVTPTAAERLGVLDARACLHSLRHRHLPAVWDDNRRSLRCHPRFREYLLERLNRRPDAEVRQLHYNFGCLLEEAGHYEDAVEVFLRAAALDKAVELADRSVGAVIERGDLDVARRWLQSLDLVRGHHHTGLSAAELMIALAADDYGRGTKVCDSLDANGFRAEVARSSSKLASMMAWCYLHTGRIDDVHEVLAVGRAGPELDAMRYCMDLLVDPTIIHPHEATARLSGSPLDAAILRVHYYGGHLSLLMEAPTSPWAAKAAESWRLGALLAMGHVDEAVRLYQELAAGESPGVWLASTFRVRLLSALGQQEAAWEALVEGRRHVQASGSVMLELLSHVDEAELALRLDHDTARARTAVAKVRGSAVGRAYRFILEQAETWLGLAMLMDGEATDAAQCLRRTVASMSAHDNVLLLPVAAIQLAEAEWRLGDADAADRATDLALRAATRQGTNYSLLGALAQFPSVLSRRLDGEVAGDSPWHELARALKARGQFVATPVAASVHLAEFGRTAVFVDGAQVRPRIKKSLELLAFLAARPTHEATRDDLLEALFDGRRDDSSTAYLRQAVGKLRQVLPEHANVDLAGGLVRVHGAAFSSESQRLNSLVSTAANLRGEDRLAVLLECVGILAAGEYLPGITSAWVDAERQRYTALATDLQLQAAELTFAAGDFRRAADLVQPVLHEDPYREAAWRLSMRLADATGDPDGVIASFRSCEGALRELGTCPSETTRRLLSDLRR